MVISVHTTGTEPSALFSSPSMGSGIFTARPNAHMTDAELRDYLQQNGYPEHIWSAGRDGLVARWRKFVAEVERGYKYGLEDYRNDLDLRAVISLVGLDDDVR